MKFKKGDEVKVVAGKDKGKTGKIEKVLRRKNKVLVSNVNIYKKHLKSRAAGKPGGIIDIIKPIPVANVALICPNCKKQTRVGYLIEGKAKSRICRKCGRVINV